MRVFITGTGTGVGKTWIATALAADLARRGRNVGALKPIETGCEPQPLDALALASACGHPALADAAGLHRARLPLAPWAAQLAGDQPTPSITALATATAAALAPFEDWIVEGAGGLLVPYDAEHDIADLVRTLELPLVLVAADVLGTLSHTRTTYEAARSRGLGVAAVVLTRPEPPVHSSVVLPQPATNGAILRARLGDVPVIEFPHVALATDGTERDRDAHDVHDARCEHALEALVLALDAHAAHADRAIAKKNHP